MAICRLHTKKKNSQCLSQAFQKQNTCFYFGLVHFGADVKAVEGLGWNFLSVRGNKGFTVTNILLCEPEGRPTNSKPRVGRLQFSAVDLITSALPQSSVKKKKQRVFVMR